MAAKRIANFNWERVLKNLPEGEIAAQINALRLKANEVVATHAKVVKPVAAIDFASYKNKTSFGVAAIENLEKSYSNRSLPKYDCVVPEIVVHKRAATIEVGKTITAAALADLEILREQKVLCESQNIGPDSTLEEVCNYFPDIARACEEEMLNMEWDPSENKESDTIDIEDYFGHETVA